MAALQVVIEQFTAERLEGRCSGWELFPQPGQVIDFTTQKDGHFYTMIDAVRPVPNQPEEVSLTLVPISGSPTLPIKEARQLSQAQFYSLKSQANAVIPIQVGDMTFDLDDLGSVVYVEPDEARSYEHIIAGFHNAKYPVIIIDPIGVDLTPIGIDPTLIGKDIRLSLQDVGILNVLNWVIQKLPNAVQGQASEFLLSLVPPTPDFVPLQYFADHPRLQEHALSAAVLHQMFVFHKAHFFANTKQMALGHQHFQHTLHLDFSNVPPDLMSYMAEGLTNVLLRYNLPKKSQLVVMSPETNETSVNKLMAQSKHRMLLVGHNEKPWQSQISDWWETKKVMGEYGLVIRGSMTDDVQLFLPFSSMAAADTLPIAVVSSVETEVMPEAAEVDTSDVTENDGLHVDWTPEVTAEPSATGEVGSDYWIDQFNTEIISPEEEALRSEVVSEESHVFISDADKPLALKPDGAGLSEADLYNLSFLESLKSQVDSPFADEDSATALDSMERDNDDAPAALETNDDTLAWTGADETTAEFADTVEVLNTDEADVDEASIDDFMASLQDTTASDESAADDSAPSSTVIPEASDIVIDWVQQSGQYGHAVDFVHQDDWKPSAGEPAREDQDSYFVEGDFNELSQAAASMASTSDTDISAYIDTEHPELTDAESVLNDVFGYDALMRDAQEHEETPESISPTESINPDDVIDMEHPELTDAQAVLNNLLGYDKPLRERDLLDFEDDTTAVIEPSSTIDPDEVINLEQPELTDAEAVLQSLLGDDRPPRERDLLDFDDDTTSTVEPTSTIDPDEVINHERPEMTDAEAVLQSLLGPDALSKPMRDDDDFSSLVSDNNELEPVAEVADDDEPAMPDIDYGDDITFISDVPSSRYRRSYDDDDDLQASGSDGWTIGGDTSGLMGGMGFFGDGADNSLVLEFSDMTMETGDDTAGFYRLLEVDIPDITKGIPPIPIIPTGNLEFEGDVGNLENFEDLSREIASDLIETVHTSKLEAKQEDLELEAQVIQGSTKAYEQVYEQTSDPTLRELQQWQGEDATYADGGDGIDLDINDLLNPIPASSVAQPTHIDDEDGIGAFSLDDLGFEDSEAASAQGASEDWMNQLFDPNATTSEPIASNSGHGELSSVDHIQSGGDYLGMGTNDMGWELQLTQGSDQLNASLEVPTASDDAVIPESELSNALNGDLMNPYETTLGEPTDSETTPEESPAETDWQSLIAAQSDSAEQTVSTWDFGDAAEASASVDENDLDDLDTTMQERVSHAAFNFDEEGTLIGDMDFDALGAINFGDETEPEIAHASESPSDWAETENTPYNEVEVDSLDALLNLELETDTASSETVTSDDLVVAPDAIVEFSELALNDPYAFTDPSSEGTAADAAAELPDPLEGWNLSEDELSVTGFSDEDTPDPLADVQPNDYQSIAMDLDDDLMEVLKLEGVDFDMMSANAASGEEAPTITADDELSIDAADDLFGDLGDLEFSINDALPSLDTNETPETPETAVTAESKWGFDLSADDVELTELSIEASEIMATDEPEIEPTEAVKAYDVAELDLMAALGESPEATVPLDTDGEWLFESALDITPEPVDATPVMATADTVVDIEPAAETTDPLADLMGPSTTFDDDMPMLDVSWEDEMAALGQAPMPDTPAQVPMADPIPAAASDEWLFPEFDDPMAPAASSNGMSNPMQATQQEVWIDDPNAPLPVDSAEPLTIVKTSLELTSNRFQPGDHVQHKRYGMGTIKRIITMDDAQVILNINFDNVGKRLLDPSLSELEKVS